LKPEEHGAVLFLFVAIGVEFRKRHEMIHEDIEVMERLHASIMIQIGVN
jgi:hypothetical protein